MIAVVLGIVLTVAHYLSERLGEQMTSQRTKIISFSAGVSIAYIFLELLPVSFEALQQLHRLLFFLILTGFCLFHLTERHIYSHQSPTLRERELTRTHLYAFFGYHFVLGIVLFYLTAIQVKHGLLFFFPLLLHTLASTASLTEVHASFRESNFRKSFLANSTLLGVLFATFVSISSFTYNVLFSFVVGVMLYIIIRDLLPQGREGNPQYFVLGVMSYSLVVLYAWLYL